MIRKSKLISLKKEEGYALISVLMIGFLILSLFLGLFLVRYFNIILSERRVQKKKLDLAVYSAVQKHLNSSYDLQNDGMYSTDVDSINVTVQYRMKGFFYEITAGAKGRRDSSCVRYLFAPEVNKLFGNALIISRSDLDATYVGDNRIKGDMLAATDKIRKGDIFGIKTSKMKYLEGKLQLSHSLKVKLFPESMVSKLFENKGENERKTVRGDFRLDFAKLDSIKSLYIIGNLALGGADFKKKNYNNHTKIYVNGKITIEENSVSENELELISDSSITIKTNSKLENLIITSKGGIRLEKGATLKNIQIFSKKFIKAYNTLFRYPSILCIYPPSQGNTDSSLIELKGSILNGTAMLITDVTGIWGNKSKISIDEKSTVHGVIYSENNMEILGKVKGTVYTYNLYFYQPPTEYINWLVNLDINRPELNKSYLLPVGLGDKKELKVLREEWLY